MIETLVAMWAVHRLIQGKPLPTEEDMRHYWLWQPYFWFHDHFDSSERSGGDGQQR